MGSIKVINSKGIYNRCSLPRLVVEDVEKYGLKGTQEVDKDETDWKVVDRRRKRGEDEDDRVG